MITTSALLKTLGTVGAIGSAAWVFDLYNAIPEWASEPAIREMKSIVATAKHWDVTTDRLTEDVRRLDIKVKSYERYLKENFNSEILTNQERQHKDFLEDQLERDLQELEKKQRQLESADREDQALLKELSRALSKG